MLGTIKVGEKNAYLAQIGDDFQLIEFAGATIGGTSKIDPKINPAGYTYRSGLVTADEVIDVVGDLEDFVTIPEIRAIVERPGATVADVRSAAAGVVLPWGRASRRCWRRSPRTRCSAPGAGAIEVIANHLVTELPARMRQPPR